MSSNQVGRTDLTPIALVEFVFLMLSLRRLWYMGGIIHAGTNTVMNWTYLQVLGLEVRCDASDLSIYNSCV